MDLYGVQIKLDDGTDLIASITPVFVLDFIEGAVSGTRTYDIPNGLSLKVAISNMDAIDKKAVKASIIGNKLSYTCYAKSSITVYAG